METKRIRRDYLGNFHLDPGTSAHRSQHKFCNSRVQAPPKELGNLTNFQALFLFIKINLTKIIYCDNM